jgi:VWFA-related protein
MNLRNVVSVVGLSIWVAAAGGQQAGSPAAAGAATASEQNEPVETLHTGTQLVVLDATVFDRQGRLVTKVLHRDDFVIEEDKRPQVIRTFEAPAEHVATGEGRGNEKAPRTIFVLDELNFHYQPVISDVANMMNQMNQQVYLRSELVRFLKEQPSQLYTPTEVLELTHHGYKVLIPSTRNRDEAIARVKAHNPGLGSPFRDYLEETGGAHQIGAERTLTKGSMAALWSLALAQRSQPGRKNVIWLGWGGPDFVSNRPVEPKRMTSGERYAREITDLMVQARITLNLLGPGMADPGISPPLFQNTERSQTYEFAGDFGFSGYVATTGGQITNGNDVRGEISVAENYGTQYYTMSYKPDRNDFDGSFRRIRVSVKDHPEWTVLTKAGYYAMQFGGEKDEHRELQSDLSIATFEAMPFDGIGAKVVSVERVKGSDLVRLRVALKTNDLEWHANEESGKVEADVVVSAASLGSVFAKVPLNAQVGTWKLTAPGDADETRVSTEVTIMAHVPQKTQRVRIVVRDMANGRMGTVDESTEGIAKAPEVDLPSPAGLQPRPLSAAAP